MRPQVPRIATRAIEQESDLDTVWPTAGLLDAVGFQRRVRGRVADFFKAHGMTRVSPRQLMNLFLPAAPFEKLDHYSDVPMSRQPQFGKYLYDSALLSLCDAKLGSAFE